MKNLQKELQALNHDQLLAAYANQIRANTFFFDESSKHEMVYRETMILLELSYRFHELESIFSKYERLESNIKKGAFQ